MSPTVSYCYSIPYIILLGILVFLYFNEQRYIRVISIRSARLFAVLVLLFFFGCQCFVWNDWVNYYPYYTHLPSSIHQLFKTKIDFPYFRVYNQDFEIGFVLYSFLIKLFGFDYFGWVFLNSLVDFIVLYVIFKRYSHSVVLSFVAFLIFDGLSFEFNLFRNSKAILLFLLSIPYGMQRQLCFYVLLNSIGAMFHLSSLLYIPCYWCLFREIHLKWMWVIFVLSNILFIAGTVFVTDSISHVFSMLFSGIGVVMEKVERYTTTHLRASAIFSWTYLLRSILMLYVLLNFSKLRRQRGTNLLFINSLLLYVSAANIFSSIGVLYVRVTALFSFAAWIMIVNSIYLQVNRVRQLLVVLFVLIAGVKIAGESSPIMLIYRNVFWSNTDYNQNKRRWIVDYNRYLNSF